jgi:hypothetical protein
MGYALKQSSAARPLLFDMVDVDGEPVTGLSPTVVLSKNGAAFASPAGAVSEVGNGTYKVAGNSTDSGTLGPLKLYATGAGALDCYDTFEVVAYDPENVNLSLANLDAAVSSRASQASVDAVDDFLDTEVAAIKAKTDALPADPADASDIAASFAAVNATLATLGGYIDTEVAAIKAKTDLIPADPADASDIAASFSTLTTAVNTIDDLLDTEVAAIKTDTAAIKAKTDSLTFTVSSRVDANVRSVNSVAVDGSGVAGSDPWGPA